MDPMLRIGLKVLLLFLALFFYALRAARTMPSTFW